MTQELREKIEKIFLRQNDNFNYAWQEEFRLKDPELFRRIEQELSGYGPVSRLLDLPEVTEVLVNRFDRIFFEKEGGLYSSEDHFFSELTYKTALEKLSQACGSLFNRERPFLEAQLGSLRVTIVFSEMSRGHHLLSVRKQPQMPWTLDSLLKAGAISQQQKQILAEMVSTRKNLLVVGPTGSGKTSFLQALLQALPENERIVILEDTQELRPPNDISVSLLARPQTSALLEAVPLQDLVKRALRLRPDRLVVGEIRGAGATALLLALSTGHNGSFGSLHARTPDEALLRLEMLIQMGAPEWSLPTVRKLIHTTLDAVVVLEKNGPARRLSGLYKISSLESTGFTFAQLDEN